MNGTGSAMAGSCTPIPVSALDPNQPQCGSLPVSPHVILEAIHAGVGWVWGREYSLRFCPDEVSLLGAGGNQ